MYTQQEWQEMDRLVRKRWRVAIIPAALLLAAAIAVFVYGQLTRSDTLWRLTAGLTILGGGSFLFLYGLYVYPARQYRTHVHYMLNGRLRSTTGVFKSFSEDVSNREGVECHAMLINVGEKDDPEDDRLFYYDVYKPRPDMPLGSRITVCSNDRMVASIKMV